MVIKTISAYYATQRGSGTGGQKDLGGLRLGECKIIKVFQYLKLTTPCFVCQFLDADVFIVNNQTLKQLVAKKKDLVAPMLLSGGLYR